MVIATLVPVLGFVVLAWLPSLGLPLDLNVGTCMATSLLHKSSVKEPSTY